MYQRYDGFEPNSALVTRARDTESRGPVERVYRLRRGVVENADVRIVNDDRVFPSRALGDDCEVARRGRLIEGQLLHRGV